MRQSYNLKNQGKLLKRKTHREKTPLYSWDSIEGNVNVENMPSMENLTNPFTKTLSSTVVDGQRDSIWVKFISNMLWMLMEDC